MIAEPKKRISDKALKVWRISAVIKIMISWLIAATVIFLAYFFQWPQWISAVIIFLGVVNSFFSIYLVPKIRWKIWRYEVHEQEIELQHGIFIKVRTLIPMVRVQHVDTEQGPLLRKYQLASVVVHTAATVHKIPALKEAEAEELRIYISKLARTADEDV